MTNQNKTAIWGWIIFSAIVGFAIYKIISNFIFS